MLAGVRVTSWVDDSALAQVGARAANDGLGRHRRGSSVASAENFHGVFQLRKALPHVFLISLSERSHGPGQEVHSLSCKKACESAWHLSPEAAVSVFSKYFLFSESVAFAPSFFPKRHL